MGSYNAPLFMAGALLPVYVCAAGRVTIVTEYISRNVISALIIIGLFSRDRSLRRQDFPSRQAAASSTRKQPSYLIFLSPRPNSPPSSSKPLPPQKKPQYPSHLQTYNGRCLASPLSYYPKPPSEMACPLLFPCQRLHARPA